MNKILLTLIFIINLLSGGYGTEDEDGYGMDGGYGLQVGAYREKENIPIDIDFGVNYKILEQGEFYKLTLGPFDTKKQVEIFQKRYGIDGFIVGMSNTKQKDLRKEKESNLFNTKNNNIKYNANNTNTRNNNSYNNRQAQGVYAVEILSANDKNNIPSRIIKQIANLGLNPKFILDKGLYRLIVGPYNSLSLAQNVGSRVESVFGREVYVVKFDKNKIDFAQSAMEFVAEDNLDVLSNDDNEHIGYLEQQRRQVTNKYNNNPFTNNNNFQERDPRIKKKSGLAYVRKREKQQAKNLRAKFQNKNIQNNQFTKTDSGKFLGIMVSSSKNELIINGKKIGGSFLYGAYGGFKFNNNTLVGIDYFAQENKKSTTFIKNDNTAEVTSSYNNMISGYLKYRFFLPTNKSLFISSKIGLGITKQAVKTYIPINGGSTTSYTALYTEGILGLGVGFFFTKVSSLELAYNTYINTKTITSSVRVNLNMEF